MGVSISANSRIEFRISDLDTGTTATVFNGPSITIVNNTGYTVYYVYISPTASDDWGDDRLASNQVIMNGQSASLQLPHPINVVNRYDIRLKDSDGDTYTKMNVLVSANGRIEFTIRDINTAAPAQNNQALAQAAFERGEAAYDQRNWNRAIAEYTEAIRLAPNNPLYYHNRGWVYYENDDYDRAIADFTQTIRIRPNADSYYARSIAYFVNSDDTRALADVNEALRLNPNHQEAKALKDLLLSW
jgi:tetratricopeptide (TPR) repeat protein